MRRRANVGRLLVNPAGTHMRMSVPMLLLTETTAVVRLQTAADVKGGGRASAVRADLNGLLIQRRGAPSLVVWPVLSLAMRAAVDGIAAWALEYFLHGE